MVGGQLVGVVELVGPERAGPFGDLVRGFDHVARQRRVHSAAYAGNDRQFGAERRHVISLFDAERVRCHDAERVPARRADQRE
jgi:hypothetical protein